jgi:uncharacterized protein
MTQKRIALFPNHPSQIWLLKPVAELLEREHQVLWILRDKDVSIAIARELGLKFKIISKAKTGFLGNGIEFFLNFFRCVALTLFEGIDVWVTKYGCGSMAAWICGRSAIAFNDDDVDIVPLIAATSYPFSKAVIVPEGIRMGRYEHRALRYRGSHELFYLHPQRFHAQIKVREMLGLKPGEQYGLVRLSALQAHHDVGVRGASEEIILKVVQLAQAQGIRIFITSEKPLQKSLEPYRLSIPVSWIHHALYFAEFLVGDSQTMTSEAATLGTLSFRVSDFVGRISAIAKLENLGLSKGYLPTDAEKMLVDLKSYLVNPKRKELTNQNLSRYLLECSDPVNFFAETVSAFAHKKSLEEVRSHEA